MKRQTVAAVAVLAVLGFLLLAPLSASAQTNSSVCGGPNQPCANTPFGQAPAAASAEGTAPGALARTGINTEYLLLASVATLAFGCLVLLFVEARENAHLVRHRAGAGGSL